MKPKRPEIRIIIDKGEKLYKVHEYLLEAVWNTCDKFKITFYELLGIWEAIRKDIHNEVEKSNEEKM